MTELSLGTTISKLAYLMMSSYRHCGPVVIKFILKAIEVDLKSPIGLLSSNEAHDEVLTWLGNAGRLEDLCT